MAAPVTLTSLDSPGGPYPSAPLPPPPSETPPRPGGPSPARARFRGYPDELLARVREEFRVGPTWGNAWPNWYGLYGQDPDFRTGNVGGASGTVQDRKGGKDAPLFWSEIDLRGFRVMSRWLWDTNPFMQGFGRRLTDYHIGKGFQWQACLKGQGKQPYATAAAEKENPAGKLVTKGQDLLDRWRDANAWPLMSREGFQRLHRDGLVCWKFGVQRGSLPWVRWVEPEWIGDPAGSSTGPDSFGLRNDPRDQQTITDVYVRDGDGDGTQGRWVPVDRVVFAKTNTDSTVKMGVPDSFSVHEYADEARKCVRNMVVTATAQAAIAWRESFPTASQEQVRTLITQGDLTGSRTVAQPWFNGTQTVYSEKLAAGTVLRTEGSREFNPGPVSDGVASFVEAVQAALRAMCVRWGLPPYMTAKADDINFASSLTAGSPFAKAVEGGQVEWGAVERAVACRVLDLACEAGLLTPEERRQLDVEVIAPAVTSPDKGADTDRLLGLLKEKVVDPYTVQQELGYDPSHIEANWKAWNARNPQQPAPGTVPPPPAAQPPSFPGGSDPFATPVGEQVLRWLLQERDGLVKKTVTRADGVETHVWVKAADAAHVGDASPARASGGGDDAGGTAGRVARTLARLKAVGSAALDSRAGRFVKKVEHTLSIIAHKTREIAAAAAARRKPPLGEDRIRRLTKLLAIADFVGSFVAGGVVAATVHPIAGKITSTALPSVSVLYVAYSAARDPAGTWAAARQVVADTLKGRSVHESADQTALADALAGLLAGDDADWREAVFLAALAEMEDAGDETERALAAAAVAKSAPPQPATLPTPTPADFGEPEGVQEHGHGSNLVQKVIRDKNGVERHVWVAPEDAPHLDTPARAGGPGAGPKYPDHAAARAVEDALTHADLPAEKRAAYHAAASAVLARMPPTALDRVARHTSGPAKFYPDTRSLGLGLTDAALKLAMTTPDVDADTKARLRKLRTHVENGWQSIGGAVHWNTPTAGQLHLDGEYGGAATVAGRHGGKAQTPGEVYAHEFTHLVDGPEYQVSESARWKEAWAAEIGPAAKAADGSPRLTKYAHTNRQEGLAEFGRLVYGGQVPLETVEAEFPLATALFKEAKLWPAGS